MRLVFVSTLVTDGGQQKLDGFQISGADKRRARFHNASNEGHQGQRGSHAPRRASIRISISSLSPRAFNCPARRHMTPPGSAQPGRTSGSSRTNRVVKLSIHEHGGSSARILRLSTGKRFGKQMRRRRAHALPGFGYSGTTDEPSALRGERSTHGRLLYLGRRPGRMSASHTHVEQDESGANLQSSPSAGVGWSNWDESRASPAPGAG